MKKMAFLLVLVSTAVAGELPVDKIPWDTCYVRRNGQLDTVLYITRAKYNMLVLEKVEVDMKSIQQETKEIRSMLEQLKAQEK